MSVLSEFYDFYDGPEYREDQFDFYASLFDKEKGKLLELASGTGILSLELARRGFDVTGIDYDEDMVKIAQRKLAQEKVEVRKRVRFHPGNMKDFEMGETYDGILIPTNAFGYLSEPEDQRSCLQHVFRHLAPGGKLVIEETFRSPEALAKLVTLAGVERTWTSAINPQTGKHTLFKDSIRFVDFAAQTFYRTAWIEEIQEDGSIKRYQPESGYFGDKEHYFTAIELRLLVENSGFQVMDVFGSLDKSPFGRKSSAILVVAGKAM